MLLLDWKLLSATVTIRVLHPYMIQRTNVLLGEGENRYFQYTIQCVRKEMRKRKDRYDQGFSYEMHIYRVRFIKSPRF